MRNAYGGETTALVEGLDGTSVLSVEAPLWTEYVTTMSELESMLYPRLPAMAEVRRSAAGGAVPGTGFVAGSPPRRPCGDVSE